MNSQPWTTARIAGQDLTGGASAHPRPSRPLPGGDGIWVEAVGRSSGASSDTYSASGLSGRRPRIDKRHLYALEIPDVARGQGQASPASA